MHQNLYIIIMLLFFNPVLAEKVPAGYVAKWDTVPLTKGDYTIKYNKDCVSFEGTLKRGKMEQPNIIPFKIVNKTLSDFINGYKLKTPQDILYDILDIDTVVVWPNYAQSDWYLLIGGDSCFLEWLEIQPDNINSIIDLGKKN